MTQARRLPWLTLALAGVALVLFALGVSPHVLGYEPARPSLLTWLGSHLVHY